MEFENKLSPYLNIFNSTVCENIIPEEDLAYNFPYPLDPFQQEGIYRIYKNENILITAHTGSGKTVLAIYAIAHCLKHNKKVLYTSPTKSLSNQKYAEFIEKFGNNGSVGIMTGDIKMNPDAQCIIMTTEILRNILYRYTARDNEKENIVNSSLIDITEVGAVIFDEVHYINDYDRGKVWEESIILLPKEITLVMLSATIDKPEVFASWIGDIKEKNISLIPTSHRVVPLKHYFWKSYVFDNNGKDDLRWELLEILDDKGKFKNYDLMKKNYKIYDINKLMDKLITFLVDKNYIPALFFKFSRKKCEMMCKTVRKNLLTFEEISMVENTFDYYMKDYKKTYEILPQYQDVYNQLKKGVVYHHSGLIPILKEIIEILYTKGLVKILFATETFAIGVNMPTKTVLFSDLEKYDNNGLRSLRTDEYLQMSGRAGRRGLDKFGSVIILPTMELPDQTSFKNMLTGKSPILNSKFKLSYQFVLKTLCSNIFDINNFLSKTLVMNENDKKTLFMYIEKKNLETKLNNIKFTEDNLKLMNDYQKIYKKLTDTFFILKKKDKDKLEKEKKNMENTPNFKELYSEYEIYNNYLKELENIDSNIWWCNNSLKNNIDIIIKLLEEEGYIKLNDSDDNINKNILFENKQITTKGIIAMGINECQELLFTEMIYQGFLDNLEFPEIVSVISCFINEKDQSSEEKYISDLKVSNSVTNVLKKIKLLSENFIKKEDKMQLYIGSDYNLYLDFIEPSYIWAKGGTINDVYKYTNVYDGNFVKAIMRINNICENLMDICKNIEKYDICSKLENYEKILIRDITSINSLYVK
jgi:superfamily II RNA helicase